MLSSSGFESRNLWGLLDEAGFKRADRGLVDARDVRSFYGAGRTLSGYSGRNLRGGARANFLALLDDFNQEEIRQHYESDLAATESDGRRGRKH